MVTKRLGCLLREADADGITFLFVEANVAPGRPSSRLVTNVLILHKCDVFDFLYFVRAEIHYDIEKKDSRGD